MEQHRRLQRILIVDDDADYRELLTSFLGSVFDDVEVVEHDPLGMGVPGSDFDWSGVDVLILDYDLRSESGTGLDVLHDNRQSEHFPATIMLTGAGDEDVAVRAMKSGVHDYLRKERLKKSQLRDTIQAAFEQHLARREGLEDLDAVRKMATQQAEQMLEKYKARYEDTRQRQESRLKEELACLQAELEQKQAILKQNIAEKAAAEAARNEAWQQLEALQARLEEEAGARNRRDPEAGDELATARGKLARLNQELADSRRQQETAEAELLRTNWKKEQQETAQQQLQEDLASFCQEMAEQEENYSQMTERLTKVQETRARLKAKRLEEELDSNQGLLDDISGQLENNNDS